jgi:hypothetical protein
MSDDILIPLSDLEGTPSAKFENVGDQHLGKVVDAKKAQVTDINTGELKFWPDGRPQEQLLITIEKPTGDRVILYARGGNYVPAQGDGTSMQKAIGLALREAGVEGIQLGADLAVVQTGFGEATGVGKNPPRLYKAQYRPPVPVAVATEDLFSGS